jgi:hypothetical protein
LQFIPACLMRAAGIRIDSAPFHFMPPVFGAVGVAFIGGCLLNIPRRVG